MLSSTTVLGLYDHGYAIAAQRRPHADRRSALAHTRRQYGDRHRRDRAAHRFRGQRSAGNHARVVGRDVRTPVRYSARRTRCDIHDQRPTDACSDSRRCRGRHCRGLMSGEETSSSPSGRRRPAVVCRDRAAATGASRVTADLLLVSGGWNPNVALWSQSRGTLRFDERIAAFVPNPAFARADGGVGTAAGDRGLPDVDPLWLFRPGDRSRRGRVGQPFRRSRARCNRRRLAARARRRPHLDRAPQAIHDDRHWIGPGKDVGRRDVGGRRDVARR